MVAKSLWLYYLTFSRSLLSPIVDPPSKTIILNDVLKSDDSPFSPLPLSSNFNFAGKDTSIVYVSPNGAIHYSKEQPCYPYSSFGSTGICDFNSTYYGVIGGYLTDLDPSGSSDANITADYYQDRVKLNYEKVEYFDSNLQNTFSISLHSDDHITLEYLSIMKNATLNLPFGKSWMSGLRPHFNGSVYFDASAKANGLYEWHTKINGFYPSSKSIVSTGNAFVLCPVTLSWSLRNGTRSLTELQASITSGSGVSLQLVTAKLSCVNDIDYGILLSYTMNGASSVWEANCTSSFFSTVSTVNDGYGLLSCPISSDFVNSLSAYLAGFTSKLVNITVQWRSIDNDIRAWQSIPLSSTSFNITSSTSVTPTCHSSSHDLHGSD